MKNTNDTKRLYRRLSILLILCLIHSFSFLNAQNQQDEALLEEEDEVIMVESNVPLPPKHSIYGNLGVGIITSKIYTPTGRAPKKAGLEWRLGYDYIINNGFGVGLQYVHNATKFDIVDLNLDYFGLLFVYKYRYIDLVFRCAAGLGYFRAEEVSYKKYDGFGTNLDLGLEYMFSETIGLNLSVNYITGRVPNNDIPLPKGEQSGFDHINILGGISVYF